MKIKKILGFVIFGVLGLSIVGATLGGLSYFDKKKTKEVDYQSQINELSTSLTALQTENTTLKNQVGELVAEGANSNYLHHYSFSMGDVCSEEECTCEEYDPFFYGNLDFYLVSKNNSVLFNDVDSFISYVQLVDNVTLYTDEYITIGNDIDFVSQVYFSKTSNSDNIRFNYKDGNYLRSVELGKTCASVLSLSNFESSIIKL